jgi:mitogen-activated protein kinase kinase kinase
VDAADFLTKTFEIDHTARPSAGELLQHAWVKKLGVSGGKGGAAKGIVPTIEVTT